jgi:sortase A
VSTQHTLLMKVGVALMALALALVIVAVVVSVALRSEEPEGVVAAEAAATKSPDEAPLSSSSGEEGNATKGSSGEEEGSATNTSSSEKEDPSRYSTGEEEPLGYYGPSSSSPGGSVGQREEQSGEPQAVAAASEPESPGSQSAMPQPVDQQAPAAGHSEPEPFEPEPFEAMPQTQQQQPEEVQPDTEAVQSQPEGVPSQPEGQLLPGAEGGDWAEPTPQEVEEANSPRHYGGLVDGAIMALTIEEIGIYDAPVYDSMSSWALAQGIGHAPETSLPWSNTPQRNVFLAGHRMGFRGTWSRMIFYNLDELRGGERVVLEDREGRTYEYEVREVFVAEPTDVWVMGQVRGRDMLTLQTCTPIPTFNKRLIVRADRV